MYSDLVFELLLKLRKDRTLNFQLVLCKGDRKVAREIQLAENVRVARMIEHSDLHIRLNEPATSVDMKTKSTPKRSLLKEIDPTSHLEITNLKGEILPSMKVLNSNIAE